MSETNNQPESTTNPENVKPVLTIEQELADVKRQLAEVSKRGKLHEVEQADGKKKTVDDLQREANEILTEMKINSINNERELARMRTQRATPYFTEEGERKWRTGDPEIPLLDSDALAKMHGVKGYKELTPDQKALGLTFTPSDLKALNVRDYFGPGSSGRKANDLARKNPTAYKLLRLRAVEEGLVA